MNRALIDSETNKIIGKRAPSDYLAEMRESYGDKKMADLLATHAISSWTDKGIEADDYGVFIAERAENVMSLIEEATGCSMVRSIPETGE